MNLSTLAGIEADQLVMPAISAGLGIITFFVTRFFQKSEKTQEDQTAAVTQLRLMEKDVAALEKSLAKAWEKVDELEKQVWKK